MAFLPQKVRDQNRAGFVSAAELFARWLAIALTLLAVPLIFFDTREHIAALAVLVWENPVAGDIGEVVYFLILWPLTYAATKMSLFTSLVAAAIFVAMRAPIF